MGVFFRELHALVQSGIALAAACRELSRRAPGRLRGVAAEMAAAAEGGKPISSVMAVHRNLFYPWHIGIVRAAESGGFLPEALDQIAHAYEVEWETRSALRLRLSFYVFLGLPAVLLTLPALLMLTEPIPTQGWDFNLIAQSIWRYFRIVSIPIAVGLVVLVLLWQILTATARFQAIQQRLVLLLPVVGRLARAAALDRYLAALGLMLRGGMPLGQAAEEAALAAGSVTLSPRLLAIVPSLRDGVPLARALAETGLLDSEMLGLAATGEAAGELPDMLVRAAGHYRAETDAKRKILLRIAQVTFGVLWLSAAGALVLWGMRVYFDFAFRVGDWMWEGMAR